MRSRIAKLLRKLLKLLGRERRELRAQELLHAGERALVGGQNVIVDAADAEPAVAAARSGVERQVAIIHTAPA